MMDLSNNKMLQYCSVILQPKSERKNEMSHRITFKTDTVIYPESLRGQVYRYADDFKLS